MDKIAIAKFMVLFLCVNALFAKMGFCWGYSTWNDGNGNRYHYCINEDRNSVNLVGGYFVCGSNGMVTLPNEINGLPIVEIGYKNLHIHTGGSWDASSFWMDLTIPSTVTNITAYAFEGCYCLRNLSIESEMISIGEEAFSNCYRLKNVSISGMVSEIGTRAFMGCSEMDLFSALEGIKVVGAYAFNWCYSLKELKMGKDRIEKIGVGAFNSCRGLNSYNGVKYESQYKHALVKADSSITSDYTILDSVYTIGSSAFSSCKNLNTIYIPKSVTSIDAQAFCGSRAKLSVDNANPNYASGVCGELCSKDERNLIHVPNYLVEYMIPSAITNIMEYAFYECTNIEKIFIPLTVKNISSRAFCKSSILLSVANGHGVYSSDVNGLLYNSYKTKLIHVPNKYENITVPSSVTTIGEDALYMNNTIKEIDLPANVKSIEDYAFYECTNLEEVKFKSAIANIGTSAFGYSAIEKLDLVVNGDINVGLWSFNGCANLYSVSIKGWDVVADWAFDGCENLISAVIKGRNVSLDTWTFKDCEKIENVFLKANNSVEIGVQAVYDCISLTNVILEAEEISLDTWAFDGCDKLTSLVCPGNAPNVNDSTFDFCNKGCVVYTMPISKGWGVSIPGRWQGMSIRHLVNIEGDNNVDIYGDMENGYIIKPSTLITDIIVSMSKVIDARNVMVEVPTGATSVKPNGATIKMVKGENDITPYLNIPIPNDEGFIFAKDVTVKDEYVKEIMDINKGAVIDLKPESPYLVSSPTRPGLSYTFYEGNAIEGMRIGDRMEGDGTQWIPRITIKGGKSGFYAIKVSK